MRSPKKKGGRGSEGRGEGFDLARRPEGRSGQQEHRQEGHRPCSRGTHMRRTSPTSIRVRPTGTLPSTRREVRWDGHAMRSFPSRTIGLPSASTVAARTVLSNPNADLLGPPTNWFPPTPMETAPRTIGF